MRTPRLSLFMILFGTPITLLLLTNYLPLADQTKNPVVFFSCLMECLSTGIYGGCLIGMLFSWLFTFDLGSNWKEIGLIRIYASSPILFMHPISLLFIKWLTIPAMSMSLAWLIAAVDLKLHWNDLAPTDTHDETENDAPGRDEDG